MHQDTKARSFPVPFFRPNTFYQATRSRNVSRVAISKHRGSKEKIYRTIPSSHLFRSTFRLQKLKHQRLLPATEFGRGITSEEDICGGYGRGPSGQWLGGCGGPDAPADVLEWCC